MIESLCKHWLSLRAHIQLAQSLFGPGGPARVEAWFAAQLDRVTDPDFAQLFAEHITLPGIAEADFNHRIVERDGLRLLGGIRFFGGDVARPFVEAIAWAGVGAPVDWHAACRVVAEEWRAFRPRSLRVCLPASAALPEGAEIDNAAHVASYGAMARHARGEADGVQLAPLTDLEAGLELVARRYRESAAADPVLARNIAPVSRQELARSMADGHAFAIMDGGEMAGLLATEPGEIEWIEGDVVLEEVVASAHAGRGLAVAAQRALAARMRHAPDRLLIGTIDGRNAASRITAERAGRPAILRYAFLPLPE
jgi:hypothetical protein